MARDGSKDKLPVGRVFGDYHITPRRGGSICLVFVAGSASSWGCAVVACGIRSGKAPLGLSFWG